MPRSPLFAFAVFVGLPCSLFAVPINSSGTLLDSLGAASHYTVLSLSDTFQNESNVTIYGDVGVGPKGSASVMAPSTVRGTIYRDPSSTVSGPGRIDGGIVTQNMSQAITDALNASTAFNDLAATKIFSSISAATTIIGNGGTNVISLTGGIKLGGSNNLTLTGNANDRFIFNIHGGLNLNGNAGVVLSGGVLAQNVVFNFIGAGSSLSTHVGNAMQGIVLAPDRDITFHGLFGEVIGGGKKLTLMSGAVVTGFAPPVPDTGSTLLLSGLTLAALLIARSLGNPGRHRRTQMTQIEKAKPYLCKSV
jgi:hypothetical protein